MNTRQVATTGITLALVFVLGALAWQPTSAQRKAEEAPKGEQQTAGRYQMRATSSSTGSTTVIVCDTATGHCWMHYASAEAKWIDFGSPGQAKK